MLDRIFQKKKMFTIEIEDSLVYIYICMFVYVYMLAIAGQKAGPNWLKFFREPTVTL